MKAIAKKILAAMIALAILIPTVAISFAAPAIERIDLNIDAITIGVGQKVKTVKPAAYPEGSAAAFTWESADESIAKVNAKGKITGVKKGSTTITISADNGVKAEVDVTVVKKGKGVTKIALNKKSATVTRSKTLSLRATLTPKKPKNKTVIWESSNEAVATVDSNGKVTGVSVGSATISAIASSGKTAKCKVTVTGLKIKKIKLSGNTSMLRNETQQLSVAIKPADADNQELKWKSSDKKIATVDENGVVTAKKKGKVTITATAKDGSKVKGTFKITVKKGVFTPTPTPVPTVTPTPVVTVIPTSVVTATPTPVVTVVPTPVVTATPTPVPTATPTVEPTTAPIVNPTIVEFGRYEQDNNTGNGSEPLEWIVLDSNDSGYLLLSRYSIDCRRYDDGYCTWESSEMRAWLNGTFYNAAFNSSEKERILLSTIDNPSNPDYGTSGGNTTSDNVFLLSLYEARKYIAVNGVPNAFERTAYCEAKHSNLNTWSPNEIICWLRTPGYCQRAATSVIRDHESGKYWFSIYGDYHTKAYGEIRPAIWISKGSLPTPTPTPIPVTTYDATLIKTLANGYIPGPLTALVYDVPNELAKIDAFTYFSEHPLRAIALGSQVIYVPAYEEDYSLSMQKYYEEAALAALYNMCGENKVDADEQIEYLRKWKEMFNVVSMCGNFVEVIQTKKVDSMSIADMMEPADLEKLPYSDQEMLSKQKVVFDYDKLNEYFDFGLDTDCEKLTEMLTNSADALIDGAITNIYREAVMGNISDDLKDLLENGGKNEEYNKVFQNVIDDLDDSMGLMSEVALEISEEVVNGITTPTLGFVINSLNPTTGEWELEDALVGASEFTVDFMMDIWWPAKAVSLGFDLGMDVSEILLDPEEIGINARCYGLSYVTVYNALEELQACVENTPDYATEEELRELYQAYDLYYGVTQSCINAGRDLIQSIHGTHIGNLFSGGSDTLLSWDDDMRNAMNNMVNCKTDVIDWYVANCPAAAQ